MPDGRIGHLSDWQKVRMYDLVGGDAGVATLIEWIRIGRLSEQEKDLEILVLRRQLAIVEK
jgi:hypothetical protein